MEMKVFLSPQSQGVNSYGDIRSFSQGVEDAEATYIACEFFLSTFKFTELSKLLSLIFSKVRIGGQVLISDYDWYSIADQIYKGASIEDINTMIFNKQSETAKTDPIFKSCLTIEEVVKCVPDNFSELHKQFYGDTFILTLERKH
jgi:hypothetical protein